ncbi:MAG: acyl-[acyl-carrier-protein] thioesterase [Gemmiger sp.]
MQLQPYEYADTFVVYRHEGDSRGNIQPGGILRFAQQVATDQCIQYGITDEVYQKTHTAYVLAKLAVHFERVPKVDEHLTFLTMPESLKRAVNKRITQVLDEEGKEAALVDSRWVLIDTDRRVILRKHPPEVCGPWAERVDRELTMKMMKAAESESLGQCCATYSRCDMNGHLNNTRYADIVCDALPLEEMEHKIVSDLLIFYHKEVPMGESFELFRARIDENCWYFYGAKDDKKCFEANVCLLEDTAGATPEN